MPITVRRVAVCGLFLAAALGITGAFPGHAQTPARVVRVALLPQWMIQQHRSLPALSEAIEGGVVDRTVYAWQRGVIQRQALVSKPIRVVPDPAPLGGRGRFDITPRFSFGADFASDARYFARKRVELIHHDVDGVLQLQNFAARVHGDFSGKIAFGHGGRHAGDIANLVRQIAGHRVNAFGQIFPDARHAFDIGLAAQLSFGSHFARDAGYFGGERVRADRPWC